MVLIDIVRTTEGKNDTIADDLRIAPEEPLHKTLLDHAVDIPKEEVQAPNRAVMELEVTRHPGPERYEPTADRIEHRVVACDGGEPGGECDLEHECRLPCEVRPRCT